MKKSILTFFAILLFTGVTFGQTLDQLVTQELGIKYLTEVITESVNGVIYTDATNDGVNLLSIRLPAYMSFDLMREQVKSATSQYSDVLLKQNWSYRTLDDGTVYYEAVYHYQD
jgi:hypothetical protein